MPRRKLRAVSSHTVELDSAIGHMSPSQLQCRDFGHSWRPYTVEFIPQRRNYLEVLACTRCRSQRMRLLGERGELLGNAYRYSDGYLVKGLGRLDGDDRDSLRLASLQHLMSAQQNRKTG